MPADIDLTVAPTMLTFTRESWRTAQMVEVTASQDSGAPAHGTTLDLTHAVTGGDYDQMPAEPVAVSIIDEPDVPPELTIAADSAAVDEGWPAVFTVTRSGATGEPLTVTVAVTERGSFIAGAAPTRVRFAADARTASLYVATEDDAIDEPDGAVTATLAGGAGYDVGNPARATVTVRDNDAPPSLTIADVRAVESAGEMEFTVRLAGASVHQVAVSFATVAGTATAGADYGGITGTLGFEPGTAPTRTIRVAIVNDALDEADETFEVLLSGARHATLAGNGATLAATGTIEDDDPVPELTIADQSAPESAGQVQFTVALSAASGREVTVAYATAGGTATEDADYARTTGTLTFAPGGELTQTITVPITDDTMDEADTETFTVALSGAVNATVGEAATGTIVDDDLPAVSIVAAAAAVAEGHAARFTVTRVGITAEPLTVAVEVTDTGGVIAGEVPTQVTIEANEDTATLLVATEDDATDEPDGAVTAALVAGDGYELVEPARATVTVTDDDAAPELTIADVRVLESAQEMEFTVRLAAASGHRVTVTCVTEDGTATADEDYLPEVGILVLAPGQTTGTIRVAVLDDTLDEADETFAMVLGDPANATLADGTATGTIVDDDASVARVWLARFGRTVATHVAEAIDGRLTEGAGHGAHGSQATMAGRRLSPGTDLARSDAVAAVPFRTMEFRELLAGSSFSLSVVEEDESGDATGGRWTAWGRGAASQFAGEEDELSVGGEVATGLVGADYDWGRVLAGLSVAYSGGGGDFTVRGTGHMKQRTGDLQSWLLSVHPYVSLELTDRLTAWGLLGYGLGQMSLAEDARDAETDIAMLMGAFAGRGVLLSAAQSGGVALAVKADGLLLRIDSQEVAGLPAVAADVSRLRLVLEGSVDALRGPGGVLTPSLQVGARYDGGAAETGAGLEAGGGLRYAYPAWGLTLAANGRLLLTHQDRSFEEWGAGGSLRLQPGAAERGLSLGLNTSWGDAASGVERLWSQGAAPSAGLPAYAAPAGRLAAELGYGLEAGRHGLVTPYAGVTLADGGASAYRLGGRLSVGQSFILNLEADRRESAATPPEHGFRLGGTLRW